MHSKQLLILAIIISLVCNCIAKPTSFRYCGAYLSDLIKLTCGPSGYNSPDWDREYFIFFNFFIVKLFQIKFNYRK